MSLWRTCSEFHLKNKTKHTIIELDRTSKIAIATNPHTKGILDIIYSPSDHSASTRKHPRRENALLSKQPIPLLDCSDYKEIFVTSSCLTIKLLPLCNFHPLSSGAKQNKSIFPPHTAPQILEGNCHTCPKPSIFQAKHDQFLLPIFKYSSLFKPLQQN